MSTYVRNKTGDVRLDVKFRLFRATTVTVQKRKVLHILSECS